MSRSNEKSLEKIVRKLAQGQLRSPDELLEPWKGTERKTAIVALLNKFEAWAALAQLAGQNPAVKAELAKLADLAGVTDHAAQILESAGIKISEGDTPRTRALNIQRAVLAGSPVDYDRAISMLMADPELLEGTLPLLEGQATSETFRFLTTLLEAKLDRNQDHLVRTALYRLRQKGLAPEPVAAPASQPRQSQRELFAFGENRVALWQSFLYFRAHSDFTSAGDLLIYRVIEGQTFDPPEQKQNVRLDRKGLTNLADQYSQHIVMQTGLQIPFHLLEPAHARYFLLKTAKLLEATPSAQAISNFFRFIGEMEPQDPLSGLRAATDAPASSASSVLTDPYFTHWMLSADDIREYQDEVDRAEKGPIILPEVEMRQRNLRIGRENLRRYFSDMRRALWSFAFEKAAYFLNTTDTDKARQTLILSRSLADLNVPVEETVAAPWLFERTVAYEKETRAKKQEEERRTSLIMTPEEFAKQQKR